ncbi:tRNA isopentenyltransferase [Sesbania bispinosa]|nr:tRNA isopentenyltransferase [Sesbania bispinosa]
MFVGGECISQGMYGETERILHCLQIVRQRIYVEFIFDRVEMLPPKLARVLMFMGISCLVLCLRGMCQILFGVMPKRNEVLLLFFPMVFLYHMRLVKLIVINCLKILIQLQIYSRGLRQAIGGREFELLLRIFVVKDVSKREKELTEGSSIEKLETLFNGNLMEWLSSSSDTKIHNSFGRSNPWWQL